MGAGQGVPLCFRFCSEISSLDWKTPKQSFSVFYILAFLAQRLNFPISFPKDNLGFTYEFSVWSCFFGKRFWWSQGCDVSWKVESGWQAQLGRKIKMVIEGKIQALAKSFPPWTFAVWYWNVFMSSRIFQKNKSEILFPLGNHRKFVEDFHPVIIGKNITGIKHTVCANISPIKWECHFSKTQERWSCSAEDKGVILWFWLGKT